MSAAKQATKADPVALQALIDKLSEAVAESRLPDGEAIEALATTLAVYASVCLRAEGRAVFLGALRASCLEQFALVDLEARGKHVHAVPDAVM